jgi:hypothetical protein
MGFAEVLQQAPDRLPLWENQLRLRRADNLPKGGESPEGDLHTYDPFHVPSKNPFPVKRITEKDLFEKTLLDVNSRIAFFF